MSCLFTRCLPRRTETPFSTPSNQDQALINTLPTELLDEIAHFDYKDIVPLVMSCKKFYLWGACKSLTQNPKYLSLYVAQLLKSFSPRDIQKAVSRFPRNLNDCSFFLSCSARNRFNLQSLTILATAFPNLKRLFYSSAYSGYDHLDGVSGTARAIGIEITWPLCFQITKGITAFTQKITPFTPRLAAATDAMIGRIFLYAYKKMFSDYYLEKITSLFSNIEELTINFEPETRGRIRHVLQMPYAHEAPQDFSLPNLPKLKALEIEGSNVGDVMASQKDLFTQYDNLKSLRINSVIQPSGWNLPAQLTTLSLGPQETYYQKDIEYIAQTCTSLESLSVAKLSSEIDTFSITPIQGVHLHTLSIGSDVIHFPDIFITFPHLKELHLQQELVNSETTTFYPSYSLEKLSIKAAAIHPETIPSIFLQYPNLKFLSLAYGRAWGPGEIAIPPSHSNLQLTIVQTDLEAENS
jgi:hypothetical protein